MRTVEVASGKTDAPEPELESESAYALDFLLESVTALVELFDAHLATVGLVDAGSRHSESPWLYWALTAKATELGTWLPTEREWVLPVSG